MLGPYLDKVMRNEDLTEDEAASVMQDVMGGQSSGILLAALLTALRMKGERPAEIVGFARAMRAQAVPLATPVANTFDTCGTGGDGSGTFNISTVVALVVASCGVTVAKHGNRSISSQCGSADVLEHLGVNVSAPPAVVEHSLREARIGFFFAPTFHPAMRHAAPTRRELSIRTAFNLLGPLTNPAGASRQLVGVPTASLTPVLARAFRDLGSDRVWVVHGAGGLDEISTTGYTRVSECRGGTVRSFYVHPRDVGIPQASVSDLRGGDAAVNAALIIRLLDGETGPRRDIVLFNAGASLVIAGKALTIRAGMEAAARAIDSGATRDTLARMAEISRTGARAT